MKYLFSITLLALMFVLVGFNQSQAQTSLEFNQVIYQTLQGANSASYPYLAATGSLVVPAGKVWKVEKCVVSTSVVSGSIYIGSVGWMAIDDRQICTLSCDAVTGTFWLPAGTYSWQIGMTSSTVRQMRGTLSAIEFNVVP
ncbi:MAG: hypothetical protein H6581_12150 [Bacteroidia bacterium]|nr:hypothetical protein [Bacteroidia bacterium]